MSRARHSGTAAHHGSQGSFLRSQGLVVLAWAALVVNILAFLPLPTIAPIPQPVCQAIAQGALAVALVLALLANPRVVIRPNLFLTLITIMAALALMVSIHSEFFLGSTFRAVRMVGFVAVLWLLTPWWGRDDLTLLRAHRLCLSAICGCVVLGTMISPGTAFAFEGRLAGNLWPIPPTQVAHYAAMLCGTTAILWLCRMAAGPAASITLAVTASILVATHTRTAITALVLGLIVASISLFLGHARVRRTTAITLVLGAFAGTVFASQLATWALRGQTTEEVGQFTGRTKVWTAVFSDRRPLLNDLFGNGLSDQSYNGLPIDSNWVATYVDLGWVGISLEVAFLLVLVLMAITHVRGPRRAIALFILAYAVVASVTETGLSAPSPYLLDLTVAASLLAASRGSSQEGSRRAYAGSSGRLRPLGTRHSGGSGVP
jgi:hypothetical protein